MPAYLPRHYASALDGTVASLSFTQGEYFYSFFTSSLFLLHFWYYSLFCLAFTSNRPTQHLSGGAIGGWACSEPLLHSHWLLDQTATATATEYRIRTRFRKQKPKSEYTEFACIAVKVTACRLPSAVYRVPKSATDLHLRLHLRLCSAVQVRAPWLWVQPEPLAMTVAMNVT
jgi:hypothetical protein